MLKVQTTEAMSLGRRSDRQASTNLCCCSEVQTKVVSQRFAEGRTAGSSREGTAHSHVTAREMVRNKVVVVRKEVVTGENQGCL